METETENYKNTDTISSYEKTYNEVKKAINNLSLAGIDTTDYNNRLVEINDTVKEEIDNIKNESKKSAIYFRSATYSIATNKLDLLKNEILEYNSYVKTYNTCLDIQRRINNESISNDEIYDLVSKMIINLRELSRNCENINKEMFLKIYEIVFELIKFEIAIYGESVLLENIKSNDTNKIYLSMIIENKLSNLDNDQLIQVQLFRIRSNGVFCDYLDLELIKALIVSTDDKFKKRLYELLNSKIQTINNNETKLKENNEEIKQIDMNISRNNERIINLRKEINKRVLSLALAIALPISAGVGIERLAYYTSIKNAYKKTITTTSLETNKTNIEEEIDFEEANLVKLEEKRTYLDGTSEIINTEYTPLGNQFNSENYSEKIIVSFLLYLILLLPLILSNIGPFNKYKYKGLLRRYQSLKAEKNENEKYNQECKKLLIDIRNLINEDEKVRDEFNKLYELNKHLLDDEDLNNKIDELLNCNNIEEGKMLLKKHKVQIW